TAAHSFGDMIDALQFFNRPVDCTLYKSKSFAITITQILGDLHFVAVVNFLDDVYSTNRFHSTRRALVIDSALIAILAFIIALAHRTVLVKNIDSDDLVGEHANARDEGHK